MANDPQYSARSGGNRLLTLAKAMCSLVSVSAPIIRARFADRPALLAVLTAAEGVCALLPAALSEQATMDNLPSGDFYPGDGDIPGQDA